MCVFHAYVWLLTVFFPASLFHYYAMRYVTLKECVPQAQGERWVNMWPLQPPCHPWLRNEPLHHFTTHRASPWRTLFRLWPVSLPCKPRTNPLPSISSVHMINSYWQRRLQHVFCSVTKIQWLHSERKTVWPTGHLNPVPISQDDINIIVPVPKTTLHWFT